MASSSSTASSSDSSSSSALSFQSPKKYDVFISFRGEDTRFNFTSHLHEALRTNQINTYIDYRLEKGDEVWPSLEKAIENSTLFLVVFSENYASSTWCLKELAKIFECSKNQDHLVMPVFHRVDPSHVRKQSGSYERAFEEHERKRNINNQQLQKWREALTQAASLCGWHCGFNRDEAELIKEIVNRVMQKLGSRYQSEDDLKGLVGIHKRIADVESLLYKGSIIGGCQFIGIWGMGGVGKTTLAKALFNKLRFTYEGSCLLTNVRQESKRHGIDALRGKIVWELLGDKESHIGNAICPYTVSRLGRKKVFIVLDDVDDLTHLEKLVGRHEFGSGSKILITTRDKQIFGNEVDDIYVLRGLNPDEAFKLFSNNAFRNDYVDLKIRELAEEVTKYAGGNPLALKVLGRLLCGKKQEAWKSQLDKLQKLPCQEVNKILRMSFEGLDDEEEKNIFLHVACFFNYHYDVEDVKKLLDACKYSTEIGLTRLEDKALLDICGRKIRMHSLIEQMGKQIVREESLKYLTWCNIFWISKKSSAILKENMGHIEGMIINLSEVEEMCVIIKAFDSMPNLKLLKVCGDLNGQLRNKFNASDFSKATSLEHVRLLWCPELRSVHPSILSLLSLRRLMLAVCKSLTSLTSVTHLQSLIELDVSSCSRLKEFSVTSENEELHLRLSRAAIRGALRSSSGHRSKICSLDLADCGKVTSVHKLIKLRGVRDLYAEGCNELASRLLSKCDKMGALQVLSLAHCNELSELPNDIRLLSSLRNLNLSGTHVETLPSSIKHLSRLQRLRLDECERLRCLPELPPSILQLSAADCISLETMQYSPLTNEGEEGKGKESLWFFFANCKNLNRRAIKAAEARMLLGIKKATYGYARLEYPGKRVPKWFMYRDKGSSVSVNLSSIPNSEDGGFLFCAVFSKLPSVVGENIDAKWFIDGKYACRAGKVSLYLGPPGLFKDIDLWHVGLWCVPDSLGELKRKIEERKRNGQSNMELKVKFEVRSDHDRITEIKRCGVCPTSAVEYQDGDIKQIQLPLPPQPGSNAMEVASRKRKYRS
ncbi:putative disease resistance protein At4g11170 [Neltuma alba]|uniref:putative disease resistance protein At4g11170 n=1 Tax=Neltuma alba TaxID=207710 RepID=UPI0010A2FD94|nr:putative disease resistance protein At4g11170 [Prosopis alba]